MGRKKFIIKGVDDVHVHLNETIQGSPKKCQGNKDIKIFDDGAGAVPVTYK